MATWFMASAGAIRHLASTFNKKGIPRSAAILGSALRVSSRMGGLPYHARFQSSATEGNLVQVERDGKIAVVRMNRPPVNSLNYELLSELKNTISDLERDKTCQVMILASARPKVFSAGLDIMEMYKPTRLDKFWRALQDLWMTLYASPLGTIAAIEGHSPAGGCLLAMSCDYRVMATGGYRIGLNESRLGIVAPTWFIDTMTNTIGHRPTERMLSLGLQLTAEEAAKIKLVDEAVPQEQVMERAHSEAQEMLQIAAYPRAEPKRRMRQPYVQKLQDNREGDLRTFTEFCLSEQVQRSLEAYVAALKAKK